MKRLIKLITLAAAGLVFPALAQAQDVPCMRINGDYLTACPNETDQLLPFGLSSNRVQYQVFNTEGTLDNVEHGARYKAFWILGDGNFRYFDYGLMEEDLATYGQTYVYPAQETYSPMVVLAERKSNTSPPRNLKRNINIQSRNVVPGVPDSFSVRIRGNHSMDIFNHDRNRPHYPTVFAISSLAGDKLADSIYFFYNCEKQPTTYLKNKIHDRVDFVSLPNYFPAGILPVEKSTANPMPSGLSLVSRELAARFFNYLDVGVNFSNFSVDAVSRGQKLANRTVAFGGLPENPFNELRFFPALISTWNRDWIRDVSPTQKDTTLPTGHYLALSVGNKPLSPQITLKGQTIQNPVFTEAIKYFPAINATNLEVGPGRFIRGIATREVEMVAGIDPNGLQVLQVCPLGPNRYEVKIRMEVCNEGYMHEDDFKFRLKDYTGVISEPEFIAGTRPSRISATDHEWAYQWDVYLDGLPLPDGVTNRGQAEALKTCDTLIFAVTTNWFGVQRLAKGKGLELCVEFAHANPECTDNYKVDESRLSPITGFECGDMPKTSWICCIPVYITLILVVIILALLIWIALLLRRRLS